MPFNANESVAHSGGLALSALIFLDVSPDITLHSIKKWLQLRSGSVSILCNKSQWEAEKQYG